MEERVDGEIQRVKQSLRRAVWNILQDVGWCALAHVSDFVGLVRSMLPSENDANDDGGLNQRRDRDDDNEAEEDDGGSGDRGGSDDNDTAKEEGASDTERQRP